ncbi:beta-phosphoglucomutase-like phosphatase (HAD superfamily) [Saccharothrix tamanrassetensis]|uniref:Beta-phosphoglucomutase-like phosphatase (HAD superfamily) n=1 Tax=Saccharothrix tamanrassetensis TaxID=1051531 RepID=A0A841CXP4_9PSEU|nr:HAD family phosphatase [Saccharothrix tamanrassetensis]MBB5960715.1 beta-phosphoglucomutase-like phosphatase (HAD superfamily) [Saccharothrix tamanrassetensis]
MRYVARIFDFDGTLVDTGDLNISAVHAALTEHGLHDIPPAWTRTAPLADLTALRGRLHADLGARLGCTDDDFVRSARAHWLANAHRAVPIPRMVALARAAARSGPVAVASANDGLIVRAGLAAAELSEVIAVVVAREDVIRLKPAPDAFQVAARRLNVPAARCLVYENTDEGVTAARAAGMHVVDVRLPEGAVRSDRDTGDWGSGPVDPQFSEPT